MLPPLLLAVTLTIDRDHPVARFDPKTALGASIDVHAKGETAKIFTAANVNAMLAAGFHPLSYRLATELGQEAWHWNSHGTWSDAAHRQGYWTSSDESPEPITVSYGYRLPRRGNTVDQARNDGYSRIDDGDLSTYWKSNPHLADRPQWVLVDLGAPRNVDRITIHWAEPFAIEYAVQYWSGHDPINEPADGAWITIGEAHNGSGGAATDRLKPVLTRYVRVMLIRSSHTGSGMDRRDRVGFAIREISVGRGDVDSVRHAASRQGQSVIWVSSTDPWHRASDIDETMEQAGFDTVFRSGLTRSLPMLTPVALLYGTPEDSAAEIRFLRSRGYNVSRIEMGEEPDGQMMAPEDYAGLYMRWADALHAVDPALRLGGPAFQSTRNVIAFWRDSRGRTSWIGRCIAALRARGRLADFSFFSFEWYPFDNVCTAPRAQLIEAPRILERVVRRWREEGVPKDIPWLATEYGWSSYAAEPEVDITAALFNAEFAAQFLSMGGRAAYFYGYEPAVVIREAARCPTYGNLMLLLSDRTKLAAFWGAWLVTHEWLLPEGTHELFAVRGTSELLRAFAVRRPDGTWALLVINKDLKAHRVRTGFSRSWPAKAGPHTVVQYSRHEYEWQAAAEQGHPSRNLPPRRFRASGEIELPAESMSVVLFRP